MPRRTEQPYLPFDTVVATEPAPTVEVPPAARPASARLVEELGRACAEAPLEEKVLVAPSLFAGHTLVERLARCQSHLQDVAFQRLIDRRGAAAAAARNGNSGPRVALGHGDQHRPTS